VELGSPVHIGGVEPNGGVIVIAPGSQVLTHAGGTKRAG